MTQHEYIFVTISIVLGLAITRLLHTFAMLIRAHDRVTFHWSTALWSACIMVYILQLWWVGWGLRGIADWVFTDFLLLFLGSICVYGAAEMALPVPGEGELDMLAHSRKLGRLSVLSMLLYFAVGPYVNLAMLGHPVVPSLVLPLVGVAMMLFLMGLPRWFPQGSLAFAIYSLGILYLTV